MRAKKSLGQNFLIDWQVAERIIDSVTPSASKTIVEIGPGHGALTERLLKQGSRVFAIEFDRDLVPLLNQRFAEYPGFNLVEADALRVNLCSLIGETNRATVVANLPYYISTAIIQNLIAQRGCLEELVVMLQREVVDRIVAPAGSSERGYLSVLVQSFCKVEPLFDVSPKSFKPVPKVWSTVARFRFVADVTISPDEQAVFESLIGAAFAQKRKTILNNLKSSPPSLRESLLAAGGPESALRAADIDPRARAEALELQEWRRLLDVVRAAG